MKDLLIELGVGAATVALSVACSIMAVRYIQPVQRGGVYCVDGELFIARVYIDADALTLLLREMPCKKETIQSQEKEL